MDRLARNLDDLRRLVRTLTGKGVWVEFVKESLTFTGEDSPMATLLLSVMGAFAEFERALILERQREGIAAAKQRGVYTGRKPAPRAHSGPESRRVRLVAASLRAWQTWDPSRGRLSRSGPGGSCSVSPRPGTVRRSSSCWPRQRWAPTSVAPGRVTSLSARCPGHPSGAPAFS